MNESSDDVCGESLIDLTGLSIHEVLDLDADVPILEESRRRVLQDVMSGDGAVAGFQSAL
jgi:FXSXX-COOH protein